MCELCGSAIRQHSVSITERPRHTLGGVSWRGPFGKAATEAIDSALAIVQDFSARRDALWKSPVVGLSRNDGPGGVDYFAGVAVEADEALTCGFSRLEIPAMTFASSWHGPQDGDVVEHYGRMIEWLRESGYRRDTALFQQREEYPNTVDLLQPPTLRLMLPVVRDEG